MQTVRTISQKYSGAQISEPSGEKKENGMGLQAAIEKGLKEEAHGITERMAVMQAPLDIINSELIPALNSVGGRL